MANLSNSNNDILFNDLPFFKGDKAFSVIYLDGEFHLFFACSKAFKSVVLHYASYDCFSWEEREVALVHNGYVDSVTAFTQNGKIYLCYAVKNVFMLTDIRIATSKDGETFEPFPNAIIKNTSLRDIKSFYSESCRWLVGSENKGSFPAYFSKDNFTWEKSALTNVVKEGEIADYLGSPSPFVACGKTYVAYSMQGANVKEVEIDLTKGELTLGKTILETYGESMRSLMVREATPLIFIGCGSSLVPVEVYGTEQDLGFRLYRDALKSAKLRVDNGLEENKKMPATLVRERGILHIFELPAESGVSLNFGATSIEIDEYKSIIIDGVIENYGIVDYKLEENATIEITVFDMGNLIVAEVMDKLYPIPSGMSDLIKVNVGEKDYQYTSYKL